MDLREQIRQCVKGRICFVGVGNVDFGDDAFGVRLAQQLEAAGAAHVIEAGTNPDRWIGKLEGFDHAVLMDAVELGATAGSVVFMDAAEIAVRFPQVSTHKISLGLLARWIEAGGKTKAWLIGAQPDSLKAGQPLTPALQITLKALRDLLLSLEPHSQNVSTVAQERPATDAAAGGVA